MDGKKQPLPKKSHHTHASERASVSVCWLFLSLPLPFLAWAGTRSTNAMKEGMRQLMSWIWMEEKYPETLIVATWEVFAHIMTTRP